MALFGISKPKYKIIPRKTGCVYLCIMNTACYGRPHWDPSPQDRKATLRLPELQQRPIIEIGKFIRSIRDQYAKFGMKLPPHLGTCHDGLSFSLPVGYDAWIDNREDGIDIIGPIEVQRPFLRRIGDTEDFHAHRTTEIVEETGFRFSLFNGGRFGDPEENTFLAVQLPHAEPQHREEWESVVPRFEQLEERPKIFCELTIPQHCHLSEGDAHRWRTHGVLYPSMKGKTRRHDMLTNLGPFRPTLMEHDGRRIEDSCVEGFIKEARDGIRGVVTLGFNGEPMFIASVNGSVWTNSTASSPPPRKRKR
jgi:hypothetical protein